MRCTGLTTKCRPADGWKEAAVEWDGCLAVQVLVVSRPQVDCTFAIEGDGTVDTRGEKAWDIGPDGRFLMKKDVPAEYSVNVVLGWIDELKARVPPGSPP